MPPVAVHFEKALLLLLGTAIGLCLLGRRTDPQDEVKLALVRALHAASPRR